MSPKFDHDRFSSAVKKKAEGIPKTELAKSLGIRRDRLTKLLNRTLTKWKADEIDRACVMFGLRYEEFCSRSYEFDELFGQIESERKQLLATFVERPYELDQINALLGQLEGLGGGAIAVLGPVGIGKTSFLYWLWEKLEGWPILFHPLRLCTSPTRFLKSLICQADRTLHTSSWSGGTVEELRIGLESRLDEIVRKKGRCLLMVDGLDELAAGDSPDDALNWFPRLRHQGVVFLVSSQGDERLLERLRDDLLKLKSAYKEVRLLGLGEAEQEDVDGDDNRDKVVREFVAKYAGDRAEKLNRVFDLNPAFRQVRGNPLFFGYRVEDALQRLPDFPDAPESRVNLDSSPLSEAAEADRVWDRFILNRPNGPERSRIVELLCCCRPPGLSDLLLQALLVKGLNQAVALAEVQSLLKEFSRYLLRSGARIRRSFLNHGCLAGHVCGTKLSQDELRQRHKLFADVLREQPNIDPEYWAWHTIWHASQAGLDLASILTDGPLIRARLSQGLGAEHGGYLRAYLRGQDSEQSPSVSEKPRRNQLDRRKAGVQPVVQKILDVCWNDGAFDGFSPEVRQQAALMLVASRNRLLVGRALDMYDRLYDMEIHRDAKGDVASRCDPENYLLQKAWIAYQYLDDWKLALSTIDRLAERRDDPQWARAMRLKASIQFDQGSDKAGICTILRRDCLPCFERHGLRQDQGQTHEAIGIVLDAEGKWDEAMISYKEATDHYEAVSDSLGLARLCINRSIAILFGQQDGGLQAAWAEIHRIDQYLPSLPSHSVDQIEQYSQANRCLFALLGDDDEAYLNACHKIHTGERWLDLTSRTNDAVKKRFEEDYDVAESETKRLINEFNDLDDAWGATDNRINLGFLYFDLGKRKPAASCFRLALNESEDLHYPVGASMASHGLRQLGESNEGSEHRKFFVRHLEKLFPNNRFFSPCYLLLFP